MVDSNLSASSAVDTASNCIGFLDLSTEIRNSIYEHAFVKTGPIDTRIRRGQGVWRNGVWQGNPTYINKVALYTPRAEARKLGPITYRTTTFGAGILATCRQINTEATPVLYGANDFFISLRASYVDLPEPLLHENNFQHIRHLTFGKWAANLAGLVDTMVQLKKSASKFKKLQKLTIDVAEVWFAHPGASDLAMRFAPFLRAISKVQKMSIGAATEMVGIGKQGVYDGVNDFGIQASQYERALKDALKELLQPPKNMKKSGCK